MNEQLGNGSCLNPGWVKLHRTLMESKVFQDAELFRLYALLLCRASFTTRADSKKSGKGKRLFDLMMGQCIVGRNDLATILNQPAESCRDRLKRLEQYGYVHLETTQQFTRVTVVNYGLDEWCDVNESAKQSPSKRRPNAKGTSTKRRSITSQPPQIENENKAKNEEIERLSIMIKREREREEVGATGFPPSVVEISRVMRCALVKQKASSEEFGMLKQQSDYESSEVFQKVYKSLGDTQTLEDWIKNQAVEFESWVGTKGKGWKSAKFSTDRWENEAERFVRRSSKPKSNEMTYGERTRSAYGI